MSLQSRYPWVPMASPPPSTSPSMPPGLTRIGVQGSGRGRGLAATCLFPAGSAIAVFDRPLLAIPDGNVVTSTCDWCLRRGISSASPADLQKQANHLQQPVQLQACTGCKYVCYCSKKCQAAAWKEVHKVECAALKKRPTYDGYAATVSVHSRAVLQLLARLKRDDEAVRDAVGDVPFYGSKWWKEPKKGELEALVGEFQKGADWQDTLTKAMGALDMTEFDQKTKNSLEVFGENGAVTLTAALFCKVQLNAFNTEDPDYSNPGILVDTVLSMANHSCIPNAAVRLAGRTVILRALKDIEEGDEIEISYVDCTESTVERQQKLEGYHFKCKCPRCTADLDVYQVCAENTVMPMNSFSLQSDLSLYTNPPINRSQFSSAFPALSDGSPKYRRATERVMALLGAEMWAVHPLPEMYADFIAKDDRGQDNPAHMLANACFQATRVVPYGYVSPFEPWRVKGLLVIARLLAQTAHTAAMDKLVMSGTRDILVETLARLDHVSMCEAIVRMVIHYGPMAHSDDWVVMESARDMLADIESLKGREKQSNLLKAWASDPNYPQGRAFFEKVVYEPILRLSDIALLILATRLQNAKLKRRLEVKLAKDPNH